MLVRSEPMPEDAPSLHSDTRSKSGILTPDTNDSAESRTNSKKRKREELTEDQLEEDLFHEDFSVKPHPSSVHSKSRLLKPLAILARSDLPLAWLDRSRAPPSSTWLPESKLYEANIKILDLEQRMSNTPSVLIALLDDKKSRYAIEYDSPGRYVIFKLSSSVDLNKIYSVAIHSRTTASRPQSRAASVSTRGGDDVFVDRHSQIDGPTLSKRKKLAIEALTSKINLRRPSTASTVSQTEASIIPNPLLAAAATDATLAQSLSQSYIPASQGVVDVQPEPTREEILENIRSQYLENLYLSKASTAYFAKGPLSRARATYQLDIDSTYDMKELIEFLKTLILPSKTLETKYREGVVEAISKIDAGDASDVVPGKATRKKRAPNKIKLAKNGLYTSEDTLIQKWWENYDPAMEVPGTSRESITRSRITELRIRETQLQMIVILETLQLQKMAPAPEPVLAGDLPAADSKAKEKVEKPLKTTKAKKPQDLPALVNIHVDRLAIWQSVSAGESKGAVQSVEEVDETNKPTGITDKHAADTLKGFCVEVIVPFFSSRLPEICDGISRKLGGPRIIPSARPPMKKSATIANPGSRPGAATKRAAPRVSEAPTLERLLTEDRAQSRQTSRGPSRAISLMRSATMPGLKRETSETPSLSRIPSFETQTRSGVNNSRKPREIDITFSSLIRPALKKAEIANEVQNAISAIRRPNRLLAGQSIAELSEKRKELAASQSRKAKKPVRNALFDGVKSQGVQIQATPKGNRHKDAMAAEPQLPRMYGGGHGHDFEPEPAMIPPSSVSRVASSGSRLGVDGAAGESEVLKATPMKRKPDLNQQAMDNTPTRKRSLSRSTFEQSISATPARVPSFSQSMNAAFQSTAIADTITDTPVRPSSSRMLFSEHLQRGRSGAPPSPSPPKRQSSVRDFMGPPALSRNENSIFETPKKVKPTPAKVPSTPDQKSAPLRPLDFGRKNEAVPESPLVHVPAARQEQQAAPPSSQGEDIYKALGWDDEDEL